MRLFPQRHAIVPVLRFSGTIGMVTPLRPGITMAATAAGIERAFRASKTPAIALLINSPGGSPVQSHLIYRRIRALAAETDKKVYAFAEDVCASGGYFLALAGDEIFGDPSSIVGSIGVVSSGFGFHRMIDKLGIDRRVYTAGTRKMSLDPFAPEKPEEIERLKAIQRDVHLTFTGLVRERRGQRLKGSDEELFSGEFWSGQKASELGLLDGLAELRTKMHELFGDKVRLPVVSFDRGWLRRRLAFTGPGRAAAAWDATGASFADDLLSSLETRALWARFGL